MSSRGTLGNIAAQFGISEEHYRSLWACSIGFACALATWFPGRLGIGFNFTSTAIPYLSDYVALAFLAAIVVVWIKIPDFKFSNVACLIATVGIAGTVDFALQFVGAAASLSIPSDLVDCVYKLTSMALLLFWIEQAQGLTSRFVMLSMGIGCLSLAVLEIFLLAFDDVISQILFVLLPVACLGCLQTFKRHRGRNFDALEAGASQKRNFHPVLAAIFLSSSVFLSVLVGSAIQTYLRHTDSMLISAKLMGAFDAAGVFLAALAILSLFAFSRGRGLVSYSMLIAPSVLALAYVLSLVVPPEWAYLSYAQLAVARRFAIVFWLAAIVAYAPRFSVPAAIMILFYRLAQVVGAMPLTLGMFDYLSSSYSLFIVGELVALVALCPFTVFACVPHAKPAMAGSDNRATTILAQQDRRQAANQDVNERIASKYGLSKRESDVVALLDEGWRAAAIADKLVLSVSTVKNHMRSIYKKLGVHSQEELRHLIEEERSLL